MKKKSTPKLKKGSNNYAESNWERSGLYIAYMYGVMCVVHALSTHVSPHQGNIKIEYLLQTCTQQNNIHHSYHKRRKRTKKQSHRNVNAKQSTSNKYKMKWNRRQPYIETNENKSTKLEWSWSKQDRDERKITTTIDSLATDPEYEMKKKHKNSHVNIKHVEKNKNALRID